MAAITSNGTGGGNASAGSTWTGGVTPTTGDTITVQAQDIVTIDANLTLGSKASGVGHAFQINGTNGTTFASLRVAAGVTLTLRGFDLTTNTLGLINQYGHFEPQPGSTVLGDVGANFGSKILNKGRFRALGTSGSPIALSIPAATISTLWSGATQVAAQSYSIAGAPKYWYDAQNSVGVFRLGLTTANICWIANSPTAPTGPGSPGVGAITWGGTNASLFTTEVSSLALVNGAGKYFADYDTGFVYFNIAYSASTITFTASYSYIADSATSWRGWGIDCSQGANSGTAGTGTPGNSLEVDHCSFSFMGSQAASSYNTGALYCKGFTGGQSDASTLLQVTNCTTNNCYSWLNLQNCTGDATHFIQVANNATGCGRGSTSSGWTIGFCYPSPAATPFACSYIQIKNSTFDERNYWICCENGGARPSAHQSIQITGNTGTCAGFFNLQRPDQCTIADGLMSGNKVQFLWSIYPNPPSSSSYEIAHPGGTSGHPFVITGNTFAGLAALNANSYLTIDSNVFYKCWIDIGATQASHTKRANLLITNNLFYDGFTSAYDIQGQALNVSNGPALDLGWNFPMWWDVVVMANNTFIGYNNGYCWINGSFDLGFASVITNLEVINNLHYAGSTNFGSRSIWRAANTANNKFPVAVKQLDNNLTYQSGAPHQLWLNGGTAVPVRGCTPMMGGSPYNTNAARNVKGVTLACPGYSPGSPHAGSTFALAYTWTSWTNFTLAWGGGTAIQLCQDSGGGATVSASAGPTINGVASLYAWTLNDSSKAWSTTLNNANCPAACWLYIYSGTGAGYMGMITTNTATSLTVVPSPAPSIDSTSLYTIIVPEVTLTDANGTVEGITITGTGVGNTTAAGGVTYGFSGGGGTGAAATVVLGPQGGQPRGQLYGGVVTAGGSGYTSAPAVTVTGFNGSGSPTAVANLGTIQAGIYLPSLVGSSQTDSGITLAFNGVGIGQSGGVASQPDPLLANAAYFLGSLGLIGTPASLPTATDAANAKFTSSSSAKDAGTAQDAPALDYFGTSRPQGSAFDIGFFELPAPSAETAAIALGSDTVAASVTCTVPGTTLSFGVTLAGATASGALVAAQSGGSQFATSITLAGATLAGALVAAPAPAAAAASIALNSDTIAASVVAAPSSTVGMAGALNLAGDSVAGAFTAAGAPGSGLISFIDPTRVQIVS